VDLSVFGTLTGWFGLLLTVDGIVLTLIFGVARVRDFFGRRRMLATSIGVTAVGIQLLLTSAVISYIFLKPVDINPGVASLTPDCSGMEATTERLPAGSLRRGSAFLEYQSGAGLACIRH